MVDSGQHSSALFANARRTTRTILGDGQEQTLTERLSGVVISSVTTDGLTRSELTSTPTVLSSTLSHSVNGRIAYSIDAQGGRTDYEYDSFGRQAAVVSPEVTDGTTGLRVRPRTEYAYDVNGRQAIVRDHYGHETQYAYDSQCKPSSSCGSPKAAAPVLT